MVESETSERERGVQSNHYHHFLYHVMNAQRDLFWHFSSSHLLMGLPHLLILAIHD